MWWVLVNVPCFSYGNLIQMEGSCRYRNHWKAHSKVLTWVPGKWGCKQGFKTEAGTTSTRFRATKKGGGERKNNGWWWFSKVPIRCSVSFFSIWIALGLKADCLSNISKQLVIGRTETQIQVSLLPGILHTSLESHDWSLILLETPLDDLMSLGLGRSFGGA